MLDGVGMGDLIPSIGLNLPTSADCTHAQTSMDAMNATYNALDPSLQPQFSAAVQSLNTTYNENTNWLLDNLPLSPSCTYTLLPIGVQADNLNNQMLAAAQNPTTTGASTTYAGGSPSNPSGGGLFQSLTGAANVLVWGIAAIFLLQFYQTGKK